MRQISELINLADRTALITGGAGHVGRAMAEALAEQKARIIVLDIDGKKAKEVAFYISDTYNVESLGLGVNLENEDEVFNVPKALQDFSNSIDILINNAAFCGTTNLKGWAVPFEEQSIETWRRALEVNLTSPFALIQCCLPLLKRSDYASIINVSSIYGTLGPDLSLYEGTSMGNPGAYAASKGGITQLTRWLSTVLAPNIRVNTISPGGIERGQFSDFQERYIKKVPMNRMGIEEDIKGITVFLASDMSSYITGQNFMVDGGLSAW